MCRLELRYLKLFFSPILLCIFASGITPMLLSVLEHFLHFPWRSNIHIHPYGWWILPFQLRRQPSGLMHRRCQQVAQQPGNKCKCVAMSCMYHSQQKHLRRIYFVPIFSGSLAVESVCQIISVILSALLFLRPHHFWQWMHVLLLTADLSEGEVLLSKAQTHTYCVCLCVWDSDEPA